jgi:hypothetical protein
VIPVANSPRRRQQQHALVYCGGSQSLFAPILTREPRFRGQAVCGPAHNTRQPCLESLLDALGIGRGQSIFGAKNSMSPICSFLVRLNPFDFSCELVA